MNQLIVCREYPPVPGGGIGTYTAAMARALAERGETVHVVAQQWHGARHPLERQCAGRLIIHRLPYDNWAVAWGRQPHPAVRAQPALGLFNSAYAPQCFAWQAAALIEALVEQAAIDLIEAPEYEAPLYFFLLRRALGQGPRRQPPCLVQLHSPTEIIAQHNGWPAGAADVALAAQLEAFTLGAADGLVCPSAALADEAANRYRLKRSSIAVIPLPLASNPVPPPRADSAWTGGSICFVGRLEPRKGILEYLEAAVAVAGERPDLLFEFAGANVLASDPVHSAALLEERLPRPVRRQFRFHGALPRRALAEVWRRARLAVVPSRWENFPYVCVEAMLSGLPVLATRQGALPEMIVDGGTGWLAAEAEPLALADGLRRALATPAAELKVMGAAAAQAIRALCDPQRVAAEQMALRSALVSGGARRSRRLPGSLPISHRSRLEPAARRQRRPGPAEGAVVPAAADAAGVQAAMAEAPAPVGLLLLLDGREALAADFAARCAQIFAHCPEVGLVAGWIARPGGRLEAPPCPTFPDQWDRNAAALPLAVRTEAMAEAGGLPAGPADEAVWGLANAVLAAGWVGVTAPTIAAHRTHSGAAAELPARARERFAALLQQEGARVPWAGPVLRPALSTWTARLALAGRYARHPRALLRLAAWGAGRLARAVAWAPPVWWAAATRREARPPFSRSFHD